MTVLFALLCLAASYRPGDGTDLQWTIECLQTTQEVREQAEDVPGQAIQTAGDVTTTVADAARDGGGYVYDAVTGAGRGAWRSLRDAFP